MRPTQRKKSVHRITVHSPGGNVPNRMPMLDNFPVFIKPEKIHRDVLIVTKPNLVHVQSY